MKKKVKTEYIPPYSVSAAIREENLLCLSNEEAQVSNEEIGELQDFNLW